ncbi:helix-turn-helix domain-containing protein, partial [Candidatus Saccharibacteria bacterium]|nr:helix-turn-helix domain-containing protein [Candidatus Saccharibacteria bacterium]
GDAHGLIPNQIIEVKSNVVEAFLGRIEDPETNEDSDLLRLIEPAFRTVMVTELKDAALIRSKFGDVKGFELLRTQNDFIQKAIKRYEGREVQHTGDGFMASFASVSNCVKCALDIQEHFKEHNRHASGFQVDMAIGLSAGDPVTEKDYFFGEAIQLAKRLGYIAGEGQILMSSTVRDHYKKEGLEVLSEKEAIKALNPIEEKLLNRLIDVMEKAWNQEGFNVGDLGRQMALSKSQLYRKITSLTGHSPNEFIKEFRLKKAIGLIEKQQGNISEIAFETGFNSPSYFSKCFHKRFGILPSDYADAIA